MSTNLYAERFEKKKKHTAYEKEAEYWKDLFRCLDILFLAGGWIHREMQTEVEKTRPESSVENEIQHASLHIKSRLQHTPEKEKFRYRILIEKMKFTDWEQFLFLLSFAVCTEEKYAQICMRFPGNEGNKVPTLTMAVALYQTMGTLSVLEWAGAVQKKSVLFRCFLDTSMPDLDSHTSYTMVLNGRVLGYLYGKDELGTELEDLAEIFRYTDTLEPIRIRQEKRDALSGYMEQIAEETDCTGNVIGLYGAEGIGKRFLVQSAAKVQKQNLLFVDMERILMATIEELRILLDKIRLECVLLPAIPCFVGYEEPEWTNREDEPERQEQTPQGLCFLLAYIRKYANICVNLYVNMAKKLSNSQLLFATFGKSTRIQFMQILQAVMDCTPRLYKFNESQLAVLHFILMNDKTFQSSVEAWKSE